ncbi:hypothetical protein M5G20_25995 [Pseudomonas sp. TNT2022 ID1044]|uniref:hypothetical protein n=1 Tax=Pseudomonas sp. TNT2022 ID1044 TaxID=2942636 RepID=UPI0023603D47|nr:hypothetical protein [Pseudomonas sp. TNT2022 ID1044]MDD0999296.1 hypothetical protein [Pseudomonas sp. TNT2022 ID1044]
MKAGIGSFAGGVVAVTAAIIPIRYSVTTARMFSVGMGRPMPGHARAVFDERLVAINCGFIWIKMPVRSRIVPNKTDQKVG